MKSYLLACALTAVVGVALCVPPVCRNGQYVRYTHPCPMTCERHLRPDTYVKPMGCAYIKISRCECDRGYVLAYSTSLDCVRPDECGQYVR